MKTCSKCKTSKSFIEFNKDKSKLAGLCSSCKVCFSEYYINNKANKLEYQKLYAKNNNTKVAALVSKRKAAKLQAIPKWADLDKIKEIYKTCPKGYHVDHIIPLKGENVCGLHVENNLRHLPAEENIRKSNKYA